MAPKLEVSGKRILFFTKVILTFLVISILLFLNYVDLQETNRNRKFLCLIRDVYTASEDSKLNFEDYELQRVRWLSKTNPDLHKKHTDARLALVNTLNKHGSEIGARHKGSGNNPNRVILMSRKRTVFPTNNTSRSGDLSDVVIFGYGAANRASFGTVAMGIDSFLRHSNNDTVNLLTGIDVAAFDKELDSLLKPLDENRNTIPTLPLNGRNSSTVHEEDSTSTGVPSLGSWEFNNISLQNGALHLTIKDANQSTGQESPYTYYNIKVPVKTDSAIFPCAMQFVDFYVDSATVHELATNSRRQEELRKLYGSFNLDFIDNLSTESFNKNNNAISILGFDISRKWFPIAMFLVLTGIYIMLYKTTRQASISSTKIISGYESDDALDFLIDSKWMRFAVWVITPAVLLFLVLYSTLIQYNLVVYAGMITAGLASLVLGWLAYVRSLRL
jgi:hypothetical protein